MLLRRKIKIKSVKELRQRSPRMTKDKTSYLYKSHLLDNRLALMKILMVKRQSHIAFKKIKKIMGKNVYVVNDSLFKSLRYIVEYFNRNKNLETDFSRNMEICIDGFYFAKFYLNGFFNDKKINIKYDLTHRSNSCEFLSSEVNKEEVFDKVFFDLFKIIRIIVGIIPGDVIKRKLDRYNRFIEFEIKYTISEKQISEILKKFLDEVDSEVEKFDYKQCLYSNPVIIREKLRELEYNIKGDPEFVKGRKNPGFKSFLNKLRAEKGGK